VNKWQKRKYGKLPPKLAITNPLEAVCVDLIGPYTLKGKDRTQIHFICVTVIYPATSCFEVIELLVSQLLEHDIPPGTQGRRGINTQKEQKELTFIKHQLQ
jgi:hypothetical protein